MIAQDGFRKMPAAIDGPRSLQLSVSKSDFITLFPGESWTDRIPLDDDELAEPFQVGERYIYQFIGTSVQWWDWGTIDVRVLHNAFDVNSGAIIDFCRITEILGSEKTRQATMSVPKSSYLHPIRLNSW